MAVSMPLMLSGVAGASAPGHVHLPSATSVRATVDHLVDDLLGRHAPVPTVPRQASGTAAGKPHSVPAAVTRAVENAVGREAGKGRGQVAPYESHEPAARRFTTGPATGGFNPKTSKPVASATTASSDLYRNADGSYTQKSYAGVVNYRTASGAWAPIDTGLVASGSGRLAERANSIAVSFATRGSSSSLGSLSNDGGVESLSVALEGASDVPGSAAGSSVIYDGILPDTDVAQTATATGFSELLRLRSPMAGSSWVFRLDLKGLTAVVVDGSVYLADSSGTVRWVIGRSSADSGVVDRRTGAEDESPLSYALVSYAGQPALEVSLSRAWLAARGRVFPVTADLAVAPAAAGMRLVTRSASGLIAASSSSSYDANQSTYVSYSSSDCGGACVNDEGASDTLKSGYSGSLEAIDYLAFVPVQADLPNEHVTAASLHMFDIWAYQCSTAEPMNVNQVTEGWENTASTVDETYPGPTHDSTNLTTWDGTAPSAACDNTDYENNDEEAGYGTGGWISMPFNSDGLDLVNGWTLSRTDDYGVAVYGSQSDDNGWKVFDSANDGDVSNSNGIEGTDCTGDCEPYLNLTYEADTPPDITSQYPPDNYNSATLTPELLATGDDPDDWPNGGTVQYQFSVYTSSGTKVVESALLDNGDWTVPSGDLSWDQTYYWTVQDFDGIDDSATATISYFSTPVPQPLITSGLSQNDTGPGFDPASGDWTTSATDANVTTIGPALAITRDYNSEDPRVSGAFGAGWSSVLDMKVAPGQTDSSGSTATEVVTYPDGEQVAFGLTSTAGVYAAPPGRYATLTTASGGGFTLTDKNDTKYTFTQSLGNSEYGITSIADALGHTETFTYNSSDEITAVTSASGRALTLTWNPASTDGSLYPHVASVVTPDVVSEETSTALTWTYSYSGDELSTVCPPTSTTACTKYTYTSGSDYPDAVLDSGPQSYWRLDETSGTTAASSVQLNEGTDDATYNGVTLGASGALTGSSATSASFNGSSSYVTLPVNLVSGASYQSVSMWFKTSSDNGVLFSYQAGALSSSTSTGGYTPSIYVGSDGKLHAEFWYSGGVDPMSTSGTVTDGKWHLITLTASGDTQTLYLDGVAQGTLSGAVDVSKQDDDYVGGGWLGGEWPDESNYETDGNVGYSTYFNGDISDAAFWTRPLTATEVSAQYSSGTTKADLLTEVTRPSGSVYSQASYDPLTGRATSVTDSNGANWTLNPPTVTGSSQVYASSVLGAQPQDYWRLAESGNTDADNQLIGGTAVYNDVTQGVTGGPFSDTTVDSFNGSSSYLALPDSLVTGTGDQTVSLWFKTTTAGGVLLSNSADAIASSSSTTGWYTPMLYVGTDGHLYGEFWGASATMKSSGTVDDGKWHNAVLAAGTAGQAMYVDGAQDDTATGTVEGGAESGYDEDNVDVGAGFIGGSWPAQSHSSSTSSTGYMEYFNGDVGEVAWYGSQLSAGQVSDQWNASKYSSGLTPVQTDTVTDPGGNTLTYTYDLLNGDRVLSQTDGRSDTTTYGYDVNGFQDEVINPDGDVTETGYDPRGNMVSETTCQDQAASKCSTAYYSYYPNDTSTTLTPDPRNDMLLTYRDPRSSSATDTTYETTYTYDTSGDVTAVTTPPVAGSASGQITGYLYTDGTTDNGGYDDAIPPKGLPYQVTTPGGAVTKTLYLADGDVGEVIDPDGLQTLYAYDGLGRVSTETVVSDSYPDGLTTTYAYDGVGQVTTETDPSVTNRVTGAIHTAQTTTTYDADGDVLTQTVTDTTGGDASREVQDAYNSNDLLTSQIDAANAKTTFTYNSYGDLASETDPAGDVTDYTYDPDGNLTSTVLENSKITNNGGTTTDYTVDAADRTTAQVLDPSGLDRTTTISYTPDDQEASVTQSGGTGSQTTAYTYDPGGNMTSQSVSQSGAGGPSAWFPLQRGGRGDVGYQRGRGHHRLRLRLSRQADLGDQPGRVR
jgi:YD repeat-containing protein